MSDETNESNHGAALWVFLDASAGLLAGSAYGARFGVAWGAVVGVPVHLASLFIHVTAGESPLSALLNSPLWTGIGAFIGGVTCACAWAAIGVTSSVKAGIHERRGEQ